MAVYLKTRSAFHFRKAQPVESHVLMQEFSDNLYDDTTIPNPGYSSAVFQNKTAIPLVGAQEATPLWIDAPGTNIGFFSDAPSGQVAYCNGIDACIWGGDEVQCGSFITSFQPLVNASDPLYRPIDYTSAVINTKSDVFNVAIVGSPAPNVFFIGFNRPAQGVNLYIPEGSANGTPNVMTVSEFNGTSWSALTVTDGTIVGGASLAKSGKVSWLSTVDTSKPVYLNGYFMYWYQFQISAGAAQIYHVTGDLPWQPILDIWGGTFVPIDFYINDVNPYTEDVQNVLNDDFIWGGPAAISATTLSYSMLQYHQGDTLNIIGPTYNLYVGFTDKMTGLVFHLPSGAANTVPNVMTIKYWDGAYWQSVGAISDGTILNGCSFGQSGVVSWCNPNLADERKVQSEISLLFPSISSTVPMYFYQISFSADVWGTEGGAYNADVLLYYVAGISAPIEIGDYNFCIHAADRLMLGCNNSQYKNELLVSAQNMPDVWSGDDSYSILFGDDKALTCGAGIFAQYASNIFNMVIVCKLSETWSLTWEQASPSASGVSGFTWNRYCISPNIGCPAPQTMKAVSVALGKSVNETKVVAIWRGNDGIYISNGQAPLSLSHHQIKNVFDQTKPLHVNLAMIPYESAFVDNDLEEYHWLWASNDNVTLNKEYVLDLKTFRWFEIDRTTGARLQCGCDVQDTEGNWYTYGFIDAGYMCRLEWGTSFLGEPIASTLEFGDQLLIAQDLLSETRVSRVNLITKAKNLDGVGVILTVRRDGAPDGEQFVLSAGDVKHSYANFMKNIYSTPGVFHTFKLQTWTSLEWKGFEPLYFAVYKIKERDHTLNDGIENY